MIQCHQEDVARRSIPLTYDGYYSISESMDESFDVPVGSSMTLFVEAEDIYGLRYRLSLEEMSLDSNGNPTFAAPADNPTEIYDAQGTLLWSDYYI